MVAQDGGELLYRKGEGQLSDGTLSDSEGDGEVGGQHTKWLMLVWHKGHMCLLNI